jgi:hypothetical protein
VNLVEGCLTLEQARPAGLQQHPSTDPEQPCADARITSEPERSATGANERLLRKLLGVVRVADHPQEVREHFPLVPPKDFLEIQGSIPLDE